MKKNHPILPNIKLRKYSTAEMRLPSFDSPAVWENDRNSSDINELTNAFEWCYAIDGIIGRGNYETEMDATTAAEQALFREHSNLTQKSLELALLNNDFKTAIFLAEGRGYWRGVADIQKQMNNLVDKITYLVEPYQK